MHTLPHSKPSHSFQHLVRVLAAIVLVLAAIVLVLAAIVLVLAAMVLVLVAIAFRELLVSDFRDLAASLRGRLEILFWYPDGKRCHMDYEILTLSIRITECCLRAHYCIEARPQARVRCMRVCNLSLNATTMCTRSLHTSDYRSIQQAMTAICTHAHKR